MDAPEFICIGEILGSHGLRGEMKVRVLTDFPDRFFQKASARLHDPSGKEPDCVIAFKAARRHKNRVLLTVEGCTSPEEARRYCGRLIQIPRSEVRPLPAGCYYHFEIVGLQVYSAQGGHLGEVVEVISTAANDVYRVRGETERLVPALKRTVKAVDLAAGRMIVVEEEEI